MFYLEVARRDRGWSQVQLSQATRIHQSFISLLELGKGVPSPDQLERLAHALDLPPEMVLKTVPLGEVAPVAVGS